MRPHRLLLLVAVVLTVVTLLPLASAADASGSSSARGPAPDSLTPAANNTTHPPPTGNLSGPELVATGTNSTYYLNATGGPAVVAGTLQGTLNWSASLTGTNTTGSSVSPTSGSIKNLTAGPVKLTVATGMVAGPFSLIVEVKSILGTENSSANFTRAFHIVVPYVVRATLVAGPNAAVLPFNVSVALDGQTVGTVAVPKLAPNTTYDLHYRYPTDGLSSGYHTFTLTVQAVHGLVTFSNGRTVLSTTFYVAPATPSYTVWYVAGIIAFFGVLFIYATRAAARRRTPGRR